MLAKAVVLVLPWFLTWTSLAQESPDRIAIQMAIVSLNRQPTPISVFVEGSGAGAEFARVIALAGGRFRVVGPLDADNPTERPIVKISHEPWGEAEITLPGQSGIGSGIVFVSAEVALADGELFASDGEGGTVRRRLLFVMKKIGTEWKTASVRLIAGD